MPSQRAYLRHCLYTAVLAFIEMLALAGAAAGEEDVPAAVQVVYFHAADDPLDKPLLAAFEQGLEDVRHWYGQQLGWTFRRSVIQVIASEKAVAHYCAELPCQPSAQPQTLFWGVVRELRQRGYLNSSAVHLIAVQTYELSVTAGQPGGPWYSLESGGIATFGRRELAALAVCRDLCRERRSALGTLAHELGHTFNLPHPQSSVDPAGQVTCEASCSETIMWNYAAYPEVGLLDSLEYPEASTLRRSPYFSLQFLSLPLKAGWNLVALPLQPEDDAAAAILAPLGEAFGVAYAWDGATSSWLSYVPQQGWDGPVLEAGQGFWLWLKEEASLAVLGSPPATTVWYLRPGWNLVGYAERQPLPVWEALAPLEGSYDAVYAWAADEGRWLSYLPALGAGTLRELRPGQGYWLHANREARLALPGPTPP